MDFSSMRPSSWNGVGAMAKVPAALWVSFVICASIQFRHSGAMRSIELRCAIAHRRISRFRVWSCGPSRNDGGLKPPRAHLDLFLGKENLPCVFDDILGLPALTRRLPAGFLHHPHLAHAARAGDAENLAGLVARQFADHV